jgi:hypothetical protein
MSPYKSRLIATFLAISMYWSPLAAHAQTHYAIASVIGDKVTVTFSQRETGTMLDPNRKTVLNLSEQGLDGEIVLQTSRLVKNQCESCKTTLFNIKAVETPEEGEQLLPGLLGSAKQVMADRLIVLTKYRDAARLRFQSGSLGRGKFTGLGFFVDRKQKVKDLKSLEVTTGYLAPYAYFKLHVIDVATGDVLLSQGLTTSTTFSVKQEEEFDPWNAISDEKKIKSLLSIINIELERVLDINKLTKSD